MIQAIALTGCMPEPLMSYLKAMGVLRLITEQKDPEVRASWIDDTFYMQSTIGSEGFLAFFLNEYVPTAIIAPWSGGSGFFEGDNKRFVEALLSSAEPRCKPYADAVRLARVILAKEKITDKPSDEIKSRLLWQYRRELPESLAQWMDAAMVLQSDGPAFAPLFGTGGNDGRLDFTQNFMGRLVTLGIPSGKMHPSSRNWLRCSLFGSTVAGLQDAAVGQFAPGRAGGPNATQGLEGDAVDNPWDFVLMLEGSLLLAGAAARRLGAGENSRSTFPFTVRPVAAAYGSASESDDEQSRGEIWLPLWERPARLAEIRNVFAEGRATVSGKPARTGLDFARAVASIGVDRGINTFSRYSFLKRSGKAYLASPLGRFEVREQADIDLLRQLDPWLDRLRPAVKSQDSPARFHSALHRIDEAIFDVCRYGASHLTQVLRALGNAEHHLATAERWRNEKRLQPLSGLSTQWVAAANDGSVEFDLALALSGVRDRENKIDPLRSHLEPVKQARAHVAWAEQSRGVVWRAADLTSNLTAVLQRRMIDGERAGCSNVPIASDWGASVDSIALFLEIGPGAVDEMKIAELLWGLIAMDQTEPRFGVSFETIQPLPLPRAYALLKLLFLPQPLVVEELVGGGRTVRFAHHDQEGILVIPEQRVLALLQADRIPEACEIATSRLRASGLTPMQVDWCDMRRTSGLRLAAALLIPFAETSLGRLINLVIRSEPILDKVSPFESHAGGSRS